MNPVWSLRVPWYGVGAATAALLMCGTKVGVDAQKREAPVPTFQTSDRCMACHNGMQTTAGEDVSIGFLWRASVMANSARDPYWQASVRRETIEHPESTAEIEDECSTCHMPMTRYEAKRQGRRGEVFAHLPFEAHRKESRAAEDGVSCSVCHQISPAHLGTDASFNGGFVLAEPGSAGVRPEYGPFDVDAGHTRIMRSSSEGFQPTRGDHVRQSALCATCHTLRTTARGPRGEAIGSLPEQMPYQEWLHSDYKNSQSCQSCHMPVINEPVAITRVLGIPREGVARHEFVAANFFLQRMLNRYRDELRVLAMPQELTQAADRTVRYLQSQAARVTISDVGARDGRLQAVVTVQNLGGHKLPTAYPSRRSWIHLTVRDRTHQVIFESGAVRPDGSIAGNDNDADPGRFEPHYAEIRDAAQVQIYESILADPQGAVTTGLLSAVGYLKDNRVLPRGFDKRTAHGDIAVHGAAADDDDFTGGEDRVRYDVPIGQAAGPFDVEAELLYQPIGYRWAANLKRYDNAAEPRRFTGYYDAMAPAATVRLAYATR
jgi:hypothetical protein